MISFLKIKRILLKRMLPMIEFVFTQQFFDACENAIHYERTLQNISRYRAN